MIATVENGGAVMDAVAAHPPDILLLDVSLPVISGFMVAEKLREIAPDVKVVFVTAHRNCAYVKRAFDIGVKVMS